MDARTVIDKYIDGRRLLEHYDFRHIDSGKSVIRACCKIHGGDNTHGFTYDTETNMWHCHTGGCGGGDAYELIKRFENLSYPQCIMRMAEIFNVDISNLELTTIKSANKKEKDEWLKLVKKKQKEVVIKPYTPPPFDYKPIKKFRNFTEETLKFFEASYTEVFPALNKEGEMYKLYKRIVIPIYFKDMMVGVALRRTKSEDIQKWCLQGFETGNILYNYNNCLKYLEEHPECEEVICVEGCFDVWSFWQQGIYNVVATFGAHITDNQIVLLQSMCTTLILAYDGDTAGVLNVRKVITELKYKFDLYVIRFNAEEDPGSVTNLNERLHDKILYTKF